MNYKYKDIYIIRHNNGQRTFANEKTVFDFYETENIFGITKANELMQEYIQATKVEGGSLEEIDITRVSVNMNNLYTEMINLQKELLKHAQTVSGDDDTFDYFPDLVYAFEQICIAVKYENVYNDTIRILNTMDNTIADEKWAEITEQQ